MLTNLSPKFQVVRITSHNHYRAHLGLQSVQYFNYIKTITTIKVLQNCNLKHSTLSSSGHRLRQFLENQINLHANYELISLPITT